MGGATDSELEAIRRVGGRNDSIWGAEYQARGSEQDRRSPKEDKTGLQTSATLNLTTSRACDAMIWRDFVRVPCGREMALV